MTPPRGGLIRASADVSNATILRFLKRVDRSGEHWLWTGKVPEDGYGRVQVNKRGMVAHRLSYVIFVGPIPDGLTLDHLCKVRNCVHPLHLEPCTAGENSLRGESPVAKNARKTHCHKGHPFSPENTWTHRNGSSVRRVCKTCRREWEANHPRRTDQKAGAR